MKQRLFCLSAICIMVLVIIVIRGLQEMPSENRFLVQSMANFGSDRRWAGPVDQGGLDEAGIVVKIPVSDLIAKFCSCSQADKRH